LGQTLAIGVLHHLAVIPGGCEARAEQGSSGTHRAARPGRGKSTALVGCANAMNPGRARRCSDPWIPALPPVGGDEGYANAPWQCLYFLPEPQGQVSLRPTLPQVDWSLGFRFSGATMRAVSCLTSNAVSPKSSSPVVPSA
jgi:hypothetical protein